MSHPPSAGAEVVVMVGAHRSGKSAWAARYATEHLNLHGPGSVSVIGGPAFDTFTPHRRATRVVKALEEALGLSSSGHGSSKARPSVSIADGAAPTANSQGAPFVVILDAPNEHRSARKTLLEKIASASKDKNVAIQLVWCDNTVDPVAEAWLQGWAAADAIRYLKSDPSASSPSRSQPPSDLEGGATPRPRAPHTDGWDSNTSPQQLQPPPSVLSHARQIQVEELDIGEGAQCFRRVSMTRTLLSPLTAFDPRRDRYRALFLPIEGVIRRPLSVDASSCMVFSSALTLMARWSSQALSMNDGILPCVIVVPTKAENAVRLSDVQEALLNHKVRSGFDWSNLPLFIAGTTIAGIQAPNLGNSPNSFPGTQSGTTPAARAPTAAAMHTPEGRPSATARVSAHHLAMRAPLPPTAGNCLDLTTIACLQRALNLDLGASLYYRPKEAGQDQSISDETSQLCAAVNLRFIDSQKSEATPTMATEAIWGDLDPAPSRSASTLARMPKGVYASTAHSAANSNAQVPPPRSLKEFFSAESPLVEFTPRHRIAGFIYSVNAPPSEDTPDDAMVEELRHRAANFPATPLTLLACTKLFDAKTIDTAGKYIEMGLLVKTGCALTRLGGSCFSFEAKCMSSNREETHTVRVTFFADVIVAATCTCGSKEHAGQGRCRHIAVVSKYATELPSAGSLKPVGSVSHTRGKPTAAVDKSLMFGSRSPSVSSVQASPATAIDKSRVVKTTVYEPTAAQLGATGLPLGLEAAVAKGAPRARARGTAAATRTSGGGGGGKDPRYAFSGPNAPAKPRTAFFYFSGKNREEVCTALGTKNPPAVAKRLGELWKALSEDERNEYKKAADLERQELEEAWARYEGTEEYQQLKAAAPATPSPGAPKRKRGGADADGEGPTPPPRHEDVAPIDGPMASVDAEERFRAANSEWAMDEEGNWVCEWDKSNADVSGAADSSKKKKPAAKKKPQVHVNSITNRDGTTADLGGETAITRDGLTERSRLSGTRGRLSSNTDSRLQ